MTTKKRKKINLNVFDRYLQQKRYSNGKMNNYLHIYQCFVINFSIVICHERQTPSKILIFNLFFSLDQIIFTYLYLYHIYKFPLITAEVQLHLICRMRTPNSGLYHPFPSLSLSSATLFFSYYHVPSSCSGLSIFLLCS